MLHNGDCLDVLRTIDDNSIDSIVTDPPYGLAFMGKRWDYDVPSVEVWAECLRVLKPGGHLLAFAGTRTQHRMCVRIEDAGFEIRDMIAWVYGSGFPKSHNLKDEWQGWGTALKPALEPITVARKPLSGTVADNVMRYGTGAINVDGCRVATDELAGKVYNNKGDSLSWGGTYGKGVAHGNAEGRWPANLIHDGSDEVVGLFPGDVKGKIGMTGNTGHGNNVFGKFNHQENRSAGISDSGSAARFFYCAKASKRDRDEGLTLPPRQYSHDGRAKPIENAYQRNESTARNNHPTVKPTDLMRYLCRLVTPPGGVVLDPFMGSGSTGKAAALEGFRFVGIERDPAYMEIARQRIAAVSPEPSEDKPTPSAPPAKTKDQLSLFP
jgi:site-specific DNA-methyltransferase (adenine-specific)